MTVVLAVRNQLPIKAVAALSVSVAARTIAGMEKRSLDAYGVAPRQAFGKRFWEGSVWGFAMLSAIVLIQRVSGHFKFDSSAPTGISILGWALALGNHIPGRLVERRTRLSRLLAFCDGETHPLRAGGAVPLG
jgi:hypothetical protein